MGSTAGPQGAINPANVLEFVMNHFRDKGCHSSEATSDVEKEVGVFLIELLENNPLGVERYEDTFLDIVEEGSESDTSEYDPFAIDEAEGPKDITEVPTSSNQIVSNDYKRRAVRYWLNEGGKKHLALKTVSRLFRFVTSERQLYSWKKQVEKMPSNPIEYKKVMYEKLYTRFMEAKRALRHVGDADLQQWALEISQGLVTACFATPAWLGRFKKFYNIKSRKLTTFVSRHYLSNDVAEDTQIEQPTSKPFIRFNTFSVRNTDQTQLPSVTPNLQCEDPEEQQNIEGVMEMKLEVLEEDGNNRATPDFKHVMIKKRSPSESEYPPRKRKPTTDDDILETRSFEVLPRDDCSVYGEHIANEIRKLPHRTQNKVKHLINNIIYDAQMGMYDNPQASPRTSSQTSPTPPAYSSHFEDSFSNENAHMMGNNGSIVKQEDLSD